jgi:hypothetical protein
MTCIVCLAAVLAILLAAAVLSLGRQAPRPHDPFAEPFGDITVAERSPAEQGRGFSAREISRFKSAGVASPAAMPARAVAEAGSGGERKASRVPSLPVSIGWPTSWSSWSWGSAVHSERKLYANFTAAEHANFLGAKVVAAATAFLDGRNDGVALSRNVDALWCELIAAPDEDLVAKQILVAARMLNTAMAGAARSALSSSEARQDRWMAVMGALVELVRHESREGRHAAHASSNGVRL